MEVTVGVLSGALRQVAVSVELSFSDGSAVSMLQIAPSIHYVLIMLSNRWHRFCS